MYLLGNVSTSVATVLKPAGLDNAKGIISTAYIKDPTDPLWKDDAGIKAWLAFMDKYFPDGDKANNNNVYGYATAQTMVQVLKQCGDNLTRENVMKQAASLKDFSSDVLLPGIKINTGAKDFFPIEQMQLMKFNGDKLGVVRRHHCRRGRALTGNRRSSCDTSNCLMVRSAPGSARAVGCASRTIWHSRSILRDAARLLRMRSAVAAPIIREFRVLRAMRAE